jgi:hypothetical protein
MAHEKKMSRLLFRTDDPGWNWKDLCQNTSRATPEFSKYCVQLIKKVARAKGLSWAPPKLPKHGAIFLNVELPPQLLESSEVVLPRPLVHPRPRSLSS